MRASLKAFWLPVSCLLFILVGCKNHSEGLSVGQRFPDGVFVDLKGREAHLHSFRGKVLLVNFWASWCAPCLQEIPSLVRLQKRIGGESFTVLGVACDDDSRKVKNLVEASQINFPVLIDRKVQCRGKYETSGYPESFVLDKAGRVMSVYDPEAGVPIARIEGPRDWDAPPWVKQLEQIVLKGR